MSAINNWHQQGRVFLWRYSENTKNYPGWHLAIDRQGADSILALLSALHSHDQPSMRTITLSYPCAQVLAIPNNRKSGVISKEKLRLHWNPNIKDEWPKDEFENEIVMRLGQSVLSTFKKALEYPKDAFDTIIVPDPILWFWGILDE